MLSWPQNLLCNAIPSPMLPGESAGVDWGLDLLTITQKNVPPVFPVTLDFIRKRTYITCRGFYKTQRAKISLYGFRQGYYENLIENAVACRCW